MSSEYENESADRPRVVIRDKRRLSESGRSGGGAVGPSLAGGNVAGQNANPSGEERSTSDSDISELDAASAPGSHDVASPVTSPSQVDGQELAEEAESDDMSPTPGTAALQRKLAERTADLQRITAEYANYRKRVERDRSVVGDMATGSVLMALLPVLDNLERAREHGDLTGAFKAVAEQLDGALKRLGLVGFGEVGDPFDPTQHEAATHETRTTVTRPTCVAVLRRGFRHGERLLRPALVAVADPDPTAETPRVKVDSTDDAPAGTAVDDG